MARRTRPGIDRRTVLGLAGLAGLSAAALAGCSSDGRPAPSPTRPAPSGAGSPSPSATSSAPSTAPAPARAGHGDITHGPRTGTAVALTFHGAGDPALVDRLLAVTRAHSSQVTVLAVGVWAAANPTMLRRLLDGGHEVGNHTWSHQTMPRLSPAQIRPEVDRCAAELRRQIGTIGSWFRPSGTPRSTAAIRSAAVRAGYPRCLTYDVDSLDYTDPGPAAIVRTVSKQVRPGSIVSLHLGHAGTMVALPSLLSLLHDRGLRAVTASDLLAGR